MKRWAIIVLATLLFGCGKKDATVEESYTGTIIVLDYDTHSPVPGAKVFKRLMPYSITLEDSAVSDASGKVIFNNIPAHKYYYFDPSKAGMTVPYIPYGKGPFTSDRTDTVYLGKNSYVNLHLHRSGIFSPGDAIELAVRHNYSPVDGSVYSENVYMGLALSPDTTIKVATFYMNPPYGTRLVIGERITRSGGNITLTYDSVNKIQYSIQDYYLNY